MNWNSEPSPRPACTHLGDSPLHLDDEAQLKIDILSEKAVKNLRGLDRSRKLGSALGQLKPESRVKPWSETRTKLTESIFTYKKGAAVSDRQLASIGSARNKSF
jgi:hypothetical protein